MYKPLLCGQHDVIKVDPTKDILESSDLFLDVREHVYLRDFASEVHLNFIGKNASGPVVVSVLTTPEEGKPGSYKALNTNSKDSFVFSVNAPGPNPVEDIQKAFLGLPENKEFYLAVEPGFCTDLATLEEKHCQKRAVMKIGIVYCKKDQIEASTMFANRADDCSPEFWRFLDENLGQKINLEGWTKYRGDMRPPGTAWYDQWNQIEVIYHVAPILNPEEIRRLIGNDIAMIFYLDDGGANDDCFFPLNNVDQFGDVPQVFAVVQPQRMKNDISYRMAFFSKNNINPTTPNTPMMPMTAAYAKKALLTKLHNGLVQTTYCPPMNRLFSVPRKATLTAIVEKYPRQVQSKLALPQLNTQMLPWNLLSAALQAKNQPSVGESLLAIKKSLIDIKLLIGAFIVVTEYSPLNSLTCALFCYLATIIPEDVKKGINLFSDWNPDNCVILKDNNGFLYSHEQKLFVIFRDDKVPEKIKQKGQAFELKKHSLRFSGSVLAHHADRLKAVWPQVFESFSALNTNQQQIFVAGYGSGGAVASLAAHVFASLKFPVTAVYTFGSTKLGNSQYCELYTELGPKTYRVVLPNDTFPFYPQGNWFLVGETKNLSAVQGSPFVGLELYIESLGKTFKSQKCRLKRVSSLPDVGALKSEFNKWEQEIEARLLTNNPHAIRKSIVVGSADPWAGMVINDILDNPQFNPEYPPSRKSIRQVNSSPNVRQSKLYGLDLASSVSNKENQLYEPADAQPAPITDQDVSWLPKLQRTKARFNVGLKSKFEPSPDDGFDPELMQKLKARRRHSDDEVIQRQSNYRKSIIRNDPIPLEESPYVKDRHPMSVLLQSTEQQISDILADLENLELETSQLTDAFSIHSDDDYGVPKRLNRSLTVGHQQKPKPPSTPSPRDYPHHHQPEEQFFEGALSENAILEGLPEMFQSRLLALRRSRAGGGKNNDLEGIINDFNTDPDGYRYPMPDFDSDPKPYGSNPLYGPKGSRPERPSRPLPPGNNPDFSTGYRYPPPEFDSLSYEQGAALDEMWSQINEKLPVTQVTVPPVTTPATPVSPKVLPAGATVRAALTRQPTDGAAIGKRGVGLQRTLTNSRDNNNLPPLATDGLPILPVLPPGDEMKFPLPPEFNKSTSPRDGAKDGTPRENLPRTALGGSRPQLNRSSPGQSILDSGTLPYSRPLADSIGGFKVKPHSLETLPPNPTTPKQQVSDAITIPSIKAATKPPTTSPSLSADDPWNTSPTGSPRDPNFPASPRYKSPDAAYQEFVEEKIAASRKISDANAARKITASAAAIAVQTQNTPPGPNEGLGKASSKKFDIKYSQQQPEEDPNEFLTVYNQIKKKQEIREQEGNSQGLYSGPDLSKSQDPKPVDMTPTTPHPKPSSLVLSSDPSSIPSSPKPIALHHILSPEKPLIEIVSQVSKPIPPPIGIPSSGEKPILSQEKPVVADPTASGPKPYKPSFSVIGVDLNGSSKGVPVVPTPTDRPLTGSGDPSIPNGTPKPTSNPLFDGSRTQLTGSSGGEVKLPPVADPTPKVYTPPPEKVYTPPPVVEPTPLKAETTPPPADKIYTPPPEKVYTPPPEKASPLEIKIRKPVDNPLFQASRPRVESLGPKPESAFPTPTSPIVRRLTGENLGSRPQSPVVQRDQLRTSGDSNPTVNPLFVGSGEVTPKLQPPREVAIPEQEPAPPKDEPAPQPAKVVPKGPNFGVQSADNKNLVVQTTLSQRPNNDDKPPAVTTTLKPSVVQPTASRQDQQIAEMNRKLQEKMKMWNQKNQELSQTLNVELDPPGQPNNNTIPPIRKNSNDPDQTPSPVSPRAGNPTSPRRNTTQVGEMTDAQRTKIVQSTRNNLFQLLENFKKLQNYPNKQAPGFRGAVVVATKPLSNIKTILTLLPPNSPLVTEGILKQLILQSVNFLKALGPDPYTGPSSEEILTSIVTTAKDVVRLCLNHK